MAQHKLELEKDKAIKESQILTNETILQKTIDALRAENLDLKNQVKKLQNENAIKDNEIVELNKLIDSCTKRMH